MISEMFAAAPLTPHPFWPWVFGFGAAACFAILGHINRNAGLLWGIAGGFFGLIIATLLSGLANAMCTPYTAPVRIRLQLVAFGISLGLTAVLALVLGLVSSRHRPVRAEIPSAA